VESSDLCRRPEGRGSYEDKPPAPQLLNRGAAAWLAAEGTVAGDDERREEWGKRTK